MKIQKINQSIRISLKSFILKKIQLSISKIFNAVKQNNNVVKGPIPLPTKRYRFTVLISPHVNKTAREQYEILTYKRLLEIINPSEGLINDLMQLDLEAGVEIQICLI